MKTKNKIFDSLFCLISQHIFNNKGNIYNVAGIKYLKRYLKDKNVFINTENNTIYIEKNEKPLYKITIEKL